MIHNNKVNWKNFAKNFLKIFPVDFQSTIDFSQLHMIRLLVQIMNQNSKWWKLLRHLGIITSDTMAPKLHEEKVPSFNYGDNHINWGWGFLDLFDIVVANAFFSCWCYHFIKKPARKKFVLNSFYTFAFLKFQNTFLEPALIWCKQNW